METFRADENQDGWLNCEEFKTFMELRNSPITHVDAKRLLKVIDPVDERFISYDQVNRNVLPDPMLPEQGSVRRIFR